jgi:hypothetical protein
MNTIFLAALELAAAGFALGGVVAAIRALWRISGHIHSDTDIQRLAIQADVEKEKARAEIASAHARTTEALQPRTIHYAPHTTHAPHTTYSPRITTSHTSTHAELPAPAPATSTPAPTETPTYANLIAEGKVGPGNPLLLGYNEGKPIYGDWRDLYSTGIGGISGSGKSWTAAYLLSQSALHGARIALLDPHSGDKESLSNRLSPLSSRFLCKAAQSPRDMLNLVKMVADELGRRKEKHRKGEHWIIVADEFSGLMRGELAAPLARLIEEIAQEGRKLSIYAMALGQVWQVKRSGGSELRDSLASAYVHRLRPNQARYLTGLTASSLPSDLLDLPTGTAYLLSTSGELHRITIPHCTDSDIETIAGLLPDTAATMPNLVSRGNTRETPAATPAEGVPKPASVKTPTEESETASNDVAEEASEKHLGSTWKTQDALNRTNTTHDPETARILAAFASGKEVREIAIELCGVGSGRAYQQASTRVQEAIRAAIGL